MLRCQERKTSIHHWTTLVGDYFTVSEGPKRPKSEGLEESIKKLVYTKWLQERCQKMGR